MSQFRTELFPFCVVPSAVVGPGTQHPVGVTLDKAMEWYWRVKYWTFVAELSEGTYTFTNIQFYDIFNEEAPLTERDMICAGPRIFATNHVEIQWRMFFFATEGFPDGAVSAGSPPVGGGGFWTSDAIRSDSGLYYPQMVFQANTDSHLGNDISTYADPPSYTLATTTLNLDGNVIPLYTSDESGFISLTLAPQEWWPYAPTSGGDDIWDTADGSQISANIVVD
jgi:hypothetical protein